jgi:hypothetical protein
LVFKLETKDEVSPAEMINDLAIEIDGDSFDYSYLIGSYSSSTEELDLDDANSGSDTYYVVFDLEDNDDEYTVDADDTVTVEFLVDFEEITTTEGGFSTGDTIKVTASGDIILDEWSVENENGDEVAGEISGSWIGETHTVIGAGVYAEIVSVSERIEGGDSSERGVFEIRFDVTAYDDVFYIDDVASTSAASGAEFTLTDIGDASASSTSATLSSTASKTSGAYMIEEGETETFTLSVTVVASAEGYFNVQLDKVLYTLKSDGIGVGKEPIETHTVAPVSDFETGDLFIAPQQQ